MLNPSNQRTLRSILAFTSTVIVVGCGGGGSSSSGTPPVVTPPAPVPQTLVAADAAPSAAATNVDPNTKTLGVAHRGPSNLSFTYSGSCSDGIAVTRTLVGLNSSAQPTLYEHKLSCQQLATNSLANTVLVGTLPSGDEYELSAELSTGASGATGLQTLDSVSSAQAAVGDTFTDFLATSVLPELDLPGVIESLILASAELLFASFSNLLDPDPLYGISSERVVYATADPAGNQTNQATGLVTRPDTSGGFTPRDRVIVLMHSTGSTPGDLDPANSWFAVANILAARGYLVIAADNWGRGGTDTDDETYLLGSRTAGNTRDLIEQVLADPAYDAYRQTGSPTNLAIIGYSQGGHSAIALWESLATQPLDNVSIGEVYAGGGPHNLYATFAGVVSHLDGSCNNGLYCRYVDSDTTVPFATSRILPGFINYTATGLTAAQAIDSDTLAAQFVADFLGNDPSLDSLKVLLQLNSYTNLTNVNEVFPDASTTLVLYHSRYDRLVPEANTAELVTAFGGSNATVQYRDNLCNSSEYEAIFDATSFVGINHTLCGLDMIDDVLGDLR